MGRQPMWLHWAVPQKGPLLVTHCCPHHEVLNFIVRGLTKYVANLVPWLQFHLLLIPTAMTPCYIQPQFCPGASHGVGLTGVGETTCLLHFLSLPLPLILWPGCVAALGEQQAGRHVLWSPQRVGVMLHVSTAAFSALFVILLSLVPKCICLCPMCLTQLRRKVPLKCVLVTPPLLSDPRQWSATSPGSQAPHPYLSSKPCFPPTVQAPAQQPPGALSLALSHRPLFPLEVLTNHTGTLFKE